MESLELRRLHSDLILTYKILFGLTKINPAGFFTFSGSTHNTRGHAYKLLVNNSRVNVRQHFLVECVIKPTNSWRLNHLLSIVLCHLNHAYNIMILANSLSLSSTCHATVFSIPFSLIYYCTMMPVRAARPWHFMFVQQMLSSLMRLTTDCWINVIWFQ